MDRRINTLLLNESLIALVPLDQEVALRARQLVRAGSSRRQRLTVLDAIHLASADRIGADYFATYDSDFGHSVARVGIPIGPPTLEFNR